MDQVGCNITNMDKQLLVVGAEFDKENDDNVTVNWGDNYLLVYFLGSSSAYCFDRVRTTHK